MIRNTLLATATLLVLSACNASGGGTPVPQSDADKLKLGAEIATLMTDPKMMDGMFDTISSSMMPMLSNACAGVPEAAKAECQAKFEKARPAIEASMKESMDQAKAMMPEMMQDMGAAIAKVYTGQELAKMKDFYSSPEGRSMTQKQPQVMQEYMPKAMARVQAMQGDMMQKMQARIAAAMGPDGATPPAPAPN